MATNKIIKVDKGLYGCIKTNGSFFLLTFSGSKSSLLVDTGFSNNGKEMSNLLLASGLKKRDVKGVLVTHADGDHVGNLTFIKKANPETKIYASRQAKEYLANCISPTHFPFPINLLASLMYKIQINKVLIDKTVSEKTKLLLGGKIEVIETPGHTDDHVSYFWREKNILFAGDVFTNFGKLKVSPNVINKDNTLNLKSAMRLLKLDPKIICCGHGSVWYKSEHPNRVDELIQEIKTKIEKDL